MVGSEVSGFHPHALGQFPHKFLFSFRIAATTTPVSYPMDGWSLGSGHLQNHFEAPRVELSLGGSKEHQLGGVSEIGQTPVSGTAWISSSFRTFLFFRGDLSIQSSTLRAPETGITTSLRFITKFSASSSFLHCTDWLIHSIFKTHWLVLFVPAFNCMY